MDNYRVVFTRSARKELQTLESSLTARLLTKIESLAEEPRPPGCRKIRGSEHLFRIRVGEYRVIYEIDDAEKLVDVVGVRHRRDAYR